MQSATVRPTPGTFRSQGVFFFFLRSGPVRPCARRLLRCGACFGAAARPALCRNALRLRLFGRSGGVCAPLPTYPPTERVSEQAANPFAKAALSSWHVMPHESLIHCNMWVSGASPGENAAPLYWICDLLDHVGGFFSRLFCWSRSKNRMFIKDIE